MSNRPWTPGPWHLDTEEGGELTGVDAEIAYASDSEPFALSEYRICGATPCGKKLNKETGEWGPLYPEVASVTFDPRQAYSDQRRNDARLIAAAPDMYEALQSVLDEAAHLAGFSQRTEQRVIDAMKKARGEDQ